MLIFVRLSLGLVSLVAALGVMGYLTRAQLQGSPSSGASPASALQAARQVAPLADLQRAAAALEEHRALTGSYAGVDLTGQRVRLVRADAAAFCVEAGDLHLAGPGSAPTPGRC